MRILKGHISQETAYRVDDYPYGFRLRCKIRYWLDHNPKHGTRLFSQTSNPKVQGESWNKPKASTYAYVAGCMIIDEKGHVTWTTLTEYDDLPKVREWFITHKDGLTPEVEERIETWIKKKETYEELKGPQENRKPFHVDVEGPDGNRLVDDVVVLEVRTKGALVYSPHLHATIILPWRELHR